MFLRSTQRKKNDRIHRYFSVVENRRAFLVGVALVLLIATGRTPGQVWLAVAQSQARRQRRARTLSRRQRGGIADGPAEGGERRHRGLAAPEKPRAEAVKPDPTATILLASFETGTEGAGPAGGTGTVSQSPAFSTSGRTRSRQSSVRSPAAISMRSSPT